MKKAIVSILMMLFVFVGCKDNGALSVVDQNKGVENENIVENVRERDELESANKDQIIEADTDITILQDNENTEVKYPIIEDNILELDEAILKEIVQSYFLVFGFDTCFYEEEFVDFESVFYYMSSAGTYPIQPFEYKILFENYYSPDSGHYTIPVNIIEDLISKEKINSEWITNLTIINDNYEIYPSDIYISWSMRPEVYQYFDEKTEMMNVPANIVNEYILSKFNTIVDDSQIDEYDKESDTYAYFPFTGGFYYDISIEEVEIEGEIVRFTSKLTTDIDDTISNIYQVTFVIKFVDGEYKFLSVDIINSDI